MQQQQQQHQQQQQKQQQNSGSGDGDTSGTQSQNESDWFWLGLLGMWVSQGTTDAAEWTCSRKQQRIKRKTMTTTHISTKTAAECSRRFIHAHMINMKNDDVCCVYDKKFNGN